MAQVLEDHPLVKALAAMLRQDIANGNIRPIEPEITARLLMGMYRNALIEAFVLGTEKDAAQLEEAIADLAINALRCPVEPKA